LNDKLMEEMTDEPEEESFPEEQDIAEEQVINVDLVDSSKVEHLTSYEAQEGDSVILTCSPDMLEKSNKNAENEDPLNNKIIDNIEFNSDTGSDMLETCQFCQKEVQKKRIVQHYTGHCMQSIKHKFGYLLDFNSIECKLCETKMKKKTSLIVHMGMVHMKVNDILVEQGFLPIQKDVRFTKNDGDIQSNEEEKNNESDKIIDAKDENHSVVTNTVANETMEVVEPILCQICRNLSLDLADLWSHYKSSHYSKSIDEDHFTVSTGLACKKCSKSFEDENTLFMHIGVCYDFL